MLVKLLIAVFCPAFVVFSFSIASLIVLAVSFVPSAFVILNVGPVTVPSAVILVPPITVAKPSTAVNLPLVASVKPIVTVSPFAVVVISVVSPLICSVPVANANPTLATSASCASFVTLPAKFRFALPVIVVFKLASSVAT